MIRRPLRSVLAALSLCAGAALCIAAPPALGAQSPRPHLDWRTIETPHFVFHFPAEMADWTASVATRMEAVHDAVGALVGSTPIGRTTVVVEDPANVANGSAWPLLRAPTLYLWPTPGDPSGALGAVRSWGEVLAVHEFAHMAHLTRRDRNGRTRLLWALTPVPTSPVLRNSPRWVIEGYATYVEGKLTGAGRPHGTIRPAVLREWALQGKLPTYAEMNGCGSYQCGAMAYLAGSAYLEWLVARSGEKSLVDLWRRMSAVQSRGFVAAFYGVYGESPIDLYDRFRVELTTNALEAQRVLATAGIVEGDTVQRLAEGTGEPAASRDGKLIAVVVETKLRPSRLVVWPTAPDTVTDRERKQRADILKRDPEDVLAVQRTPRPRKSVATLQPATGAAGRQPRFFADGERILVSRSVPLADGALRPDLYIWHFRTGQLRRVTHGAAVQHADPSPDGRSAVATRCLAGRCDLVIVDLANGRVRVLERGAPDRAYIRPRWSRDGRSVAVAVREFGPWRVAVLDAAASSADTSRSPRRWESANDGVSRYDPAFMPDGRSLVMISERGGVPNVEMISLDAGAVPVTLTRVRSAASAPEPGDSGRSVYFRLLTPRGLGLQRVRLDSGARGAVVTLDPRLTPAAQVPPVTTPMFAAVPLQPARAYGAVGPRGFSLLPGVVAAGDGTTGTLTLTSTDPVGRLAMTLTGAYGDREAWRGAGLHAAWRRFRPVIEANAFYAEQRTRTLVADTFVEGDGAGPVARFDATRNDGYAGGLLAVRHERTSTGLTQRVRAGASLGRIELRELSPLGTRITDNSARQLAFASYDIAHGRLLRGRGFLNASLGVHGATGRTRDSSWTRGVATGSLAARGFGGDGLRLDGAFGITNRDAPGFELMQVGGTRGPLLDPALLGQRVVVTALPAGYAVARRAASLRASLGAAAGFSPFYQLVTRDDSFDHLGRLFGLELVQDEMTPPYSFLPSVRVVAGVARSLDDPRGRRDRAYLTVTFRP